jgi:plastocyanin
MPAPRFLAVSWVAASLTIPAAPHAQALVPHHVVSYSSGYLPSEVTIVAGDSLSLVNADAFQSHDLVSLDRGPGGVYLFRSDVIGPAERAAVAGVESLAPSVYPFYCSVHEFMTGNLTVLGV